jgi:hypothetical protein
MHLQETVAGYLGKIEGKEADDYRRMLILQPHPNAVVMGMLLGQLEERTQALPAERLQELCHHHRKMIRDSARKLNQTLKGPDPGPFEPVQAFKSAAVRKTLDDLQALLIELPAKDADFVEVTIRYLQKDEVKETSKAQGWLLKQDKTEVTIFSPYGTKKTFRDNEKTKVRVGERTKNGYKSWQIDVVTSISTAKTGIADYVKEIADIRAKGNEGFELSPRGGLTGQFQGRGASLAEAILAAWLDRAGKAELAASILLPALDTLYEDRHIVEMARHELGDLFGKRMLVAFVGDRNYEEALKLAKVLAKHYPDTQFYGYAKEFAVQLPKRMDDFKTFKLPTPKEWEEMKKKMSRRERIDFLCERLRLLNCFQMGQPGGYFSSEEQYAEPCGLSEHAAWGLYKGKTAVINPAVELAGQEDGFGRDENAPKGLKLTMADIPALVPYLREDWFLLIVTFWRDFHPNRDLARSRQYFAAWINGLTHRDLCELARFEEMSPAQQEEHLKKIVKWAEDNKDKSEADLLCDAVQLEVERGTPWRNVSDRVDALIKMKSPKAVTFVEHYIAEKDDKGYYLPDLLTRIQALDAQKAIEWAKKYLDHKSNGVRMTCAMMIFDAGEKARAIPVLADLLQKGSSYDIGGYAAKAVDGLLNLGTKEATGAARGILRNKDLGGVRVVEYDSSLHHSRGAIIARLAQAGYPDGYRIYLEVLDAKGSDNITADRTPTAKLAVREILHDFGKQDPALQKAGMIEDFEEQRLAVRQWVEGKLKEVIKK